VTDSDSALVGRRIQEERNKADLSLSQLAASSGLTKAYLVRLENHGGNPTIEALAATADLIGAPRMTFHDDDSAIPPSLKAYADDAGLTTAEIRTLASIRWRRTEQPKTVQRWRFIHESITASRAFDDDRQLHN
jgi:transcriptional regulator with XRE-family HTH domain